MKKPNQVVLVTVSDNHFAAMLAALLKSLEESYLGGYTMVIYIIDDGMSVRTKRKLNNVITDENISIIWIPIKDAIPKNVHFPLDKSSFPLSVYSRLCIPYFLPKEVKRAIYLDADTLVMHDIKKLWDINLEGHALGAVVDRAQTVSCAWAGIPNYEELGIPADSKYFNTGVLVIDIDKWREEDSLHGVLRSVAENIRYAAFPDQYGMNVHFANKWYELDPLWNTYAQNDHPMPYVIHFTGMKPIYKGYNFNQAYKACFFYHLNLTPYKGYKAKETYFRLFNKALHMLKKRWEYMVLKIGFSN